MKTKKIAVAILLLAVVVTLGAHRPFLNHREGRSAGVASGGDGHAEVLSSIAGVLSASVESQLATQLHLRRHEVVVRIEDTRGITVAL